MALYLAYAAQTISASRDSVRTLFMGCLMKRIIGGLLILFSAFSAWAGGGYPLLIEAVKQDDGVWAIVAHNAGSSPIFIGVTLKNRVNVRVGGLSSSSMKTLEPGAKEELVLAIPEKPEEKMSFDYETKWVFGRGTNRGDHIGVYRPPFPADQTFETLNSVDENKRGPKNMYSIDILMPEGTPVIAARTGYVMDLSGQFGGDRVNGIVQVWDDLAKMGSYVRIIHDDGTWAEYLHLKPGSVTVKTGSRVEAGTQIGLSGMSGSSTRPNLQFTVLKSAGGFGDAVSQPIKMEMAGRGVKVLKVGDTIGASDSVMSPAEIVVNDPLVVAAVKKNDVDNRTGVYSARTVETDPAQQAVFIGFGLVVGVIGTLAIFLIQVRRKSESWKDVFAGFIKKRIAPEHFDKGDDTEVGSEGLEFGKEINLRPKAGYLVAEWETQCLDAIALGMPLGYVIHQKIALNRLMARPLWTRENEAGLAFLRGESIDVAIVRMRDKKIMAAIDLKRPHERGEPQMFASRAKKAMLEKANITFMEIDVDVGPAQVTALLKSIAPNEMDGFSLRSVTRKAA